MKIERSRLYKGIGEIQGDVLRYIWQPPDIYDEVHNNNIWIVYGRKGSGKSTIIDYLGSESESESESKHVIVIRPRKTNLFRRVLASINDSTEDDRFIEESFANTIDFILTVKIMRDLIEPNVYYAPGSFQETMYNFMQQHNLIKGSVLRKAINLLSVAGKLKIKPNLDEIINTIEGGVDYDDAKEALINYTSEINKRIILCIDDIDDIGFSFSRFDRIFVNGLLIFMIRANINYLENKSKIRIVLTMPSELYFHSTLWGGDWVSGKAECLIWTDTDDMKRLVNKRIAIELGIKKHNPRFEEDIFSVDSKQTWNRVFPTSIVNDLGKNEVAFDYLLRHTFYTPRHILSLCDKIIAHMPHDSRDSLSLEEASKNISKSSWDKIFQESVQEFTDTSTANFSSLFAEIYEGLEEVMRAFRSRPIIWNRSQLLCYVEERSLRLYRPDIKTEFSGESLISVLHRIGFLGLGLRDVVSAPKVNRYNIKFSFLEKKVHQGGWEIGVISPLFYSIYDMRPVENTIVNPHKELILTDKALHKIMDYDIKTNS